MTRRAPAVATWLLRHFGCSSNNDAIIGDLEERYRHGRSSLWYWKQVTTAILLGGSWKGALPMSPQSKLALTLFLLTLDVSVLASGHVLIAVAMYFIVAATVLKLWNARGPRTRALPRHRLLWLGPAAILASVTIAGIIGSIAVALLRSTSASLKLPPVSDTFLATWAGILFAVMVGFMRRRRFKNALIVLPMTFLPYLALPAWRTGTALFVFLLMQVTAWSTCVLLLMRFGLRNDPIRTA